MERYADVRVTDIMNDLIKDIDNNKISSSTLKELYKFHLTSNPYPMSNWNACRIRILSRIAVALNDVHNVWRCHFQIKEYMTVLSHKNGIPNDFMHRDSVEYVVYGYLQIARACNYIKSITKHPYRSMFKFVEDFLAPYANRELRHLEFVNSRIGSDVNKPSYKKEFMITNPKLYYVFCEELSKLT